MKPPFVIHVDEMDQFPNAIYIGRANPRRKLRKSKWHNPFKITEHVSRADVVEWFDEYMRCGSGVYLQKDLGELTGRPLACWCRRSDQERTPDTECHGDVLRKLWDEKIGQNK